jgi:Insertion element 4 transposase N-terminal
MIIVVELGWGLLAHWLAVPRELAEAAVDAEGVREQKTRSLPSVLIVYLNLVLWLFPEQGMGQCLRELAAGMPQLVREAMTWRNAASTSISQARERVGPAVMRRIFVQLAGPLGREGDLWRDAPWNADPLRSGVLLPPVLP